MEDAASRKARLKRMREEAAVTEAEQAAAAAAEPKLKFRNYAPRDEKIKGEEVAPPLVKPFEAPKVEPEEYNPDDNEELIVNVAPKKPNWDLRRDINKKLEKLERRTQRAMIELMRQAEQERLAAEGGQAD